MKPVSFSTEWLLTACATVLAACSPLPKANPKMEPAATKLPDQNTVETLIVDGIWGWHPRWNRLRERLERERGPCRIWHYNNTGISTIEAQGTELAAELRKSNRPFHLVGYSMGSLVIREAMRQAPELPLQRAVFLHSPHAGSMVAWLLPLSACREMRPGSGFLRRLNAVPWTIPTLVTWCPWDLMVLPGNSARWSGATMTLCCHVPAHAWPVVSPGIHKAVSTFLAVDRK